MPLILISLNLVSSEDDMIAKELNFPHACQLIKNFSKVFFMLKYYSFFSTTLIAYMSMLLDLIAFLGFFNITISK
jgi:hypothetical protein